MAKLQKQKNLARTLRQAQDNARLIYDFKAKKQKNGKQFPYEAGNDTVLEPIWPG